MAGEITRERVYELIQGIDSEDPDEIRGQLRPLLEAEVGAAVIRRNGIQYSVVDYILDDVGSYLG